MLKLGYDVRDVESVLVSLPDEDVDSQLAMTKVSIETLDALDAEADDLTRRLKGSAVTEIDLDVLKSDVHASKSSIVQLRTDAEQLRAMVEEYVGQRRRRREEVKKFQSTVVEIQQWLNQTRTTMCKEVKIYSIEDVNQNMRLNEVFSAIHFAAMNTFYKVCAYFAGNGLQDSALHV